MTFALSGAAAAALLVVAGAVVVQANSKPQTVVAVSNGSATTPTPTADTQIPPEVLDPPEAVPSTVPELDIDEPKTKKPKPGTTQNGDGLAQVPDPITQPTRQPATRRPQPTATKTVTKTKTPRPVDRVEPDVEPTNAATPELSRQPTGFPTKPAPKPTVKPAPKLKPNPYTAAKVCGSGYKVINSRALSSKATIYLLYSSGAGKNCVVTMSRLVYPGKVQMSALLQVKGGSSGSNPGKFTAYAGPVRLPGKGKCVIWGGSWGGLSWKSGWSHCG